MSEPSVSPADTPDYEAIRLRAQSQLSHFGTGAGTGVPSCDRCGRPTNRWDEPCAPASPAAVLAEDVLALLAVVERDKAERERLERRLKESSDLRGVQRMSHETLARKNGELADAGERDRRQIAQLTERVELLEVLGEQAVGTIEFLHGCLTEPHEDGKPGGFTYAYPEQTERRLAELRRFLPEREVCVHSKFVPGCQGCIDGEHAREVMGRAVLADKEDAE